MWPWQAQLELAPGQVAALGALAAPSEAFPRAQWRSLAASGALADVRPGALVPTAAALLASGRLGSVLAWALQGLILRQYLSGSAPPVAELAAAVRAGEALVAVAASEPGIGAHPGRLQTRAHRQVDGSWELTGRKGVVTLGLTADWLLVLAIVGEQDGRRRFALFALPADALGLARRRVAGPPLLAPADHAELTLAQCVVPAWACLHPAGDALPAARAFRWLETGLLQAAGAAALLGRAAPLLSHGSAGSAACLRAALRVQGALQVWMQAADAELHAPAAGAALLAADLELGAAAAALQATLKAVAAEVSAVRLSGVPGYTAASAALAMAARGAEGRAEKLAALLQDAGSDN